jgi:hypothetical protein
MRGLRSTLALLAVLIGLGAYIYFVASDQSVGSGEQREKVFASLEAEDIQRVTVKAENADAATAVQKEGEGWQIVEPVKAPAAASEVSSLTSAIAGLEIVRVIDEKPADFAQYGLATPRFEVSFTSAEGKPSGRLQVGAKTPTGGDLYARRNDEPRVFLIPAYQESSLNRSTLDLRDKTLLRIERDAIDGVELVSGGAPVVLAKQGEDWRITKPISARADSGTVDSLVGDIDLAQFKSVAADSPSADELKKFGLDRPATTVTLNAGSSRATLQVGAKAGDEGVYARDASRPEVVIIDATLAETLARGAEEYRRKDIFDFRAFTATRAEITRGGQTLVLERVKGEGETPDTWRRVSPNAGDADKSKVETLLTSLADIRATSFTDSTARTGLDKPAMTVFVKFDDGKKEERVSFGRSGSSVYASIPGETGAAQVDASKFDEAVKTFDELLK